MHPCTYLQASRQVLHASLHRICLPLEVMNDRRAIAKHLLEGVEC